MLLFHGHTSKINNVHDKIANANCYITTSNSHFISVFLKCHCEMACSSNLSFPLLKNVKFIF